MTMKLNTTEPCPHTELGVSCNCLVGHAPTMEEKIENDDPRWGGEWLVSSCQSCPHGNEPVCCQEVR